jgi:hypothetical protein
MPGQALFQIDPSSSVPESFRNLGDDGVAVSQDLSLAHTARALHFVSLPTVNTVNKENSMQAVAPFVVMILLLAVIFYLAHWDANRVKGKR